MQKEETHIDSGKIGRDLSTLISGEVRSEKWQRVIYATDASPYEIVPACVVLPKSKDDVVKVVMYAFQNSIPVAPRGGGSGLAGNSLTHGIVLDFTKYMNNLREITDHYVVCEPGVYKGSLDRELAKDGLFLPPDPSSSPYCAIGGMIGNNASGSHCLKYGATIDYLESAEVVLYDGTLLDFDPVEIGSEEWNTLLSQDEESSMKAKFYRSLYDLISSKREIITKSMPQVSKNSAGYRIDKLIQEREDASVGKTKKIFFNPAKVLCASEGTLGIVVSARFKIIKKPKARGILLLRYDSFGEMGKSVPGIRKYGPAAVELVDGNVIQAAEIQNPEVTKLNNGKPVTLIVEIDGDDKARVESQLKDMQEKIEPQTHNKSEIVTDDQRVEEIWHFREESLGIAYKMREAGRRTEAIIEDTVVQPENLGEYLEKLYAIYDKLGLKGVSWGHVGEGNIHTRPLIDYESHEGLEKAKQLADEIYSIVKSYNGSSSGEHGDGILRAPYIELIFGKEMVEIFRSVKKIFDPSDIMNSGKKVDSLDKSPLRDLRYGENYQTKMGEMRKRAKTLDIPSSSLESRDYFLNWGAKDRTIVKKITGRDYEFDFEKEVECCFGCGQCREQSNTRRMCPVYDGMHDELDACRGRNNLLRWMNKLEGLASTFALTDDYREAVYKHCIQCKMCMVDCPTNTNVAKLMAEARARYAKIKGHPKGYKYFFELDKYAEGGRKLAPASNWLMRNSLVRLVSEYITGIDRKKNFPPFHRKRFVDLFKEYSKTVVHSNQTNLVASAEKLHPSKNAVFFYDTYINYNNPELGMRIVRMLAENEIITIVPPQKSSGMPAIVEGAPDIGKEIAKYNVSNLIPYASKGIPIVTFSPSAGMTLKNDYLDVYDTPESRLVAQNTFDIHEYLSMLAHMGLLRREKMQPIDRKCLVHFHCHTIVQQVSNQVKEVLHMIPSLKFDILENGCCGNGGAYSFLKGNLEPSLKMGQKLATDVMKATVPVYSTGESCKVQLEQASNGVKIGLTAELLAESFSV